MASSNSFDMSAQNATIFFPDGSRLDIPIPEINSWFKYYVRVAIVYGTQAGACLLALLFTFLLAQVSQRRKLAYCLNVLSLVLGFVRAILQLVYCCSHWVEFNTAFTNSTKDINSSDVTTSVAGAIIPFFMTATVNMSLALQAHTVCKVMERKYYRLYFGFSCVVLVLALGFRLTELVTNAMAITSIHTYLSEAWIINGTLATQGISIWWFSFLFMWKLGCTIWNRKKMGWPSIKFLDSLFLFCVCTMIIPSIFAGLGFPALDNIPESGSFTMTTVALLLPLSSLWAADVTASRSTAFNISSFVGSHSLSDLSDNDLDTGGNTFGSQSTISGPLVSCRDRNGGLAPIGSTALDSIIELPTRRVRDSTELELEAMGVRVDKSYSVSAARAWLDK